MVNALFSFPMNLYSDVGLLFAPLTMKTPPIFFHLHNTIISFPGAKSITKAMKKVASGPQRDEGTKWFSELRDKDVLITVILFALFHRYDMFNFKFIVTNLKF